MKVEMWKSESETASKVIDQRLLALVKDFGIWRAAVQHVRSVRQYQMRRISISLHKHHTQAFSRVSCICSQAHSTQVLHTTRFTTHKPQTNSTRSPVNAVFQCSTISTALYYQLVLGWVTAFGQVNCLIT